MSVPCWLGLHYVVYVCTMLVRSALCCLCLHHVGQVCTMLFMSAPCWLGLHYVMSAPCWLGLHYVVYVCTMLPRSAPCCLGLHQLSQHLQCNICVCASLLECNTKHYVKQRKGTQCNGTQCNGTQHNATLMQYMQIQVKHFPFCKPSPSAPQLTHWFIFQCDFHIHIH